MKSVAFFKKASFPPPFLFSRSSLSILFLQFFLYPQRAKRVENAKIGNWRKKLIILAQKYGNPNLTSAAYSLCKEAWDFSLGDNQGFSRRNQGRYGAGRHRNLDRMPFQLRRKVALGRKRRKIAIFAFLNALPSLVRRLARTLATGCSADEVKSRTPR